jgi:hypothetical protein
MFKKTIVALTGCKYATAMLCNGYCNVICKLCECYVMPGFLQKQKQPLKLLLLILI